MSTHEPRCYVLTEYTSRAAEDRRIIVQGVDLPRRQTIIGAIGLAASLFPTLILWNLIGEYAILFPVVFLFGAWILDSRTSSGLKTRRAIALLDARRSNNGKFLVCGRPITPAASRPVHLKQSTVLVDRPDPADALDTVFAHAPHPRRAR